MTKTMCSIGLAAAREKLRSAKLRPTQQRLSLAWLLFNSGPRHVDANTLYAELLDSHKKVSLATIYNTLREFERVGLIRRIAVAGERAWYDTDMGDHRHFFIAAEDRVEDIDELGDLKEAGIIPSPPKGYRVAKVDLVVHLEPVED